MSTRVEQTVDFPEAVPPATPIMNGVLIGPDPFLRPTLLQVMQERSFVILVRSI